MRDIKIKKEHDGVTITIPFERIHPDALDILKAIFEEEHKEQREKNFIIVGCTTYKDCLREFQYCLQKLRDDEIPGIKSWRYCLEIETENFRIRFVPITAIGPEAGYKTDACFNIPKDIQSFFNKSHKSTEYNKSYLQYVYEIEKGD